MDLQLIGRLIVDKLHDRTTYVLAAIVGTLINCYGHLLVPWFRTGSNPFTSLAVELDVRPGLTLFSIFLAFAFPFCVGIYSAVVARYKIRRVESIADFPDRNPNPVFRATREGELVAIGAHTQKFFDEFEISNAQGILGEDAWAKINSKSHEGEKLVVDFEAGGEIYLVAHTPTANDEINIYMTPISGLQTNS
jgi:hypothetical protein